MGKNNFPPKDIISCSFCGRTEDAVEKLISGPNVYICDKCVHLCSSILEKKQQQKTQAAGEPFAVKLLKPKEIKAKLDEYISK